MNRHVIGDTQDTRVRVEVLVQGELEYGGATIAETNQFSTTHFGRGTGSTYRAMMTEYARKNTQIRYHLHGK